MLIDLLIASLALGVIVLLLPWRPWATTETLEADPGDAADLSDVTVLIPARNEAGTIGETLHGLARQGPGLRIIVVDDQSDDGTAAAARGAGIEVLTVVAGAYADNNVFRFITRSPLSSLYTQKVLNNWTI